MELLWAVGCGLATEKKNKEVMQAAFQSNRAGLGYFNVGEKCIQACWGVSLASASPTITRKPTKSPAKTTARSKEADLGFHVSLAYRCFLGNKGIQ